MDIKKILISVGILFAISLTAFSFGALYEEKQWQAAIQKQKIEATQELQKATNEVLERERKAREEITALETKHQNTLKELSALDSKYRKLVSAAGGLRDKGCRESSSSSKGKNTGSNGNSETNSGRVLSREATDFLLDLTAEADQMREQLRMCQDWAKRLSKD